ncbi:MAG: hypothetical protein WBO92_04030, partial [Candidatus Moraniibacteriota bacterium]
GMQGGTTRHLVELLDSQKQGVFVNSSRGVLYPYQPENLDWRERILESVVTMRAELNKARDVSNQKFLLLLGPSGVGKSTIIGELRQMDQRFRYISPVMTRELRPGEIDKIPVTDAELDEMGQQGKLLAVNHLYGVRYGTPKEPIDQAFEEGNFPILDWPVQNIEVMFQTFPGQTLTCYVEPPGVAALADRLADGRDADMARIQFGTAELEALARGDFNHAVNYRVMNAEGEARIAAQKIYSLYLKAIGEN